MVERIKEFVKEFAEYEYEANVESLNKSLDYTSYGLYQDKLNKFSGANMVFPTFQKRFLEKYPIEIIEKKKLKYFPRILFQIKHYQNPKLGKELEERFPDVKDVYVCYLSFDSKKAYPDKTFSRKLSVVNTKDGLKFIYRELYMLGDMPGDNDWVDPHDWKPKKILSYGKLIATYKIEAPEHPASLKEYEEG